MTKKLIPDGKRLPVENVKNGSTKDKPKTNVVATFPPPAPKPKEKK
ncbi:MAG TPA: hypothetical protein VKR58_02945 [Aquella sp.]|nr:hypothetical protein [Aquella sp.]